MPYESFDVLHLLALAWLVLLVSPSLADFGHAFLPLTSLATRRHIHRWHNHLNPDIRKDAWTEAEDTAILQLHIKMGNKWADIAKYLPGRYKHGHGHVFFFQSLCVLPSLISCFCLRVMRLPLSCHSSVSFLPIISPHAARTMPSRTTGTPH